jgi:chromosome segregation ATPase
MSLAEIILAFLGSNAITAIITAWIGRRKAAADAEHTIIDSASDVLAMAKAAYEARIIRLEAQVAALDKKSRELQEDFDAAIAENAILSRKVASLEQENVALSREVGELKQQMAEEKRANEYLRKAIAERDSVITELRKNFEIPLGGKSEA